MLFGTDLKIVLLIFRDEKCVFGWDYVWDSRPLKAVEWPKHSSSRTTHLSSRDINSTFCCSSFFQRGWVALLIGQPRRLEQTTPYAHACSRSATKTWVFVHQKCDENESEGATATKNSFRYPKNNPQQKGHLVTSVVWPGMA